jgi:hypothetical protein
MERHNRRGGSMRKWVWYAEALRDLEAGQYLSGTWLENRDQSVHGCARSIAAILVQKDIVASGIQ